MMKKEKHDRDRKRTRWHLEMKLKACECAAYVCQKCLKNTPPNRGVIHHRRYSRAYWDKDVIPFMLSGECVWLCRECHIKIHLAKNIDEAKEYLKTGGYCHFCGKLVYDGWKRAKSLGQKECICNGCYLKRKRANRR